MKRLRRTMLFVPGNNPGMIQSASVLGADSVILDLEDAVSLSEKDSARKLVTKALRSWSFKTTEVTVRINPITTVYGPLDLEAMLEVQPDILLIPKAEVASIQEVEARISAYEAAKLGGEAVRTKLFALIESAAGVEHVHEILASSPRLVGVLFGGEDYTSDMGVARTMGGMEIEYARNKVAVACKVHGVDAVDTPFTDVDNHEGLLADARKAKAMGFTGKAAINPRQVGIIHKGFAPDPVEVRYALRVLEAMEEAEAEGKGVFSLDGKMVDAPIIQRARQMVALAEKLGMVKGSTASKDTKNANDSLEGGLV
ncbi:MAG: CoA ester lyase [Acidaminobacter sp.]|uniref:HpcH/HpaI aldolase/citrate lyase family protein n=1 Tax=Acidaminobacter sp. TaxID=1872102 RepID=UPI00137E80A9|nr:aldolase/citrate lyase family protein [Acidaminobacter sp.]MZQ97415.1 CoA ester lyase [Acidaminobacter sp.]